MARIDADLTLPLIVAGRDLADSMADRLGDVDDRSVVVDATGLSSGTSSFAAQLVQRLLVDGNADEVIVVGAPEEFIGYARDAAVHAGRDGALRTPRHFPVGVRRA